MTHEAAPFTARCILRCQGGRYRLTFFCDICGEGFAVQPVEAYSPEEARRLAEPDARRHFNRCPRCGRWVCDGHFNENRMLCTTCAPRVCAVCGMPVPRGDQYCTCCGAPQFETSQERKCKHE